MYTEIEDKLGVLVNHAREFCPYYIPLLPPLGKPLPTDLDDYLKSLPLLSRHTVQTQQARLISSVGDTSLWRKVSTTGTTGERVEVVLNPETKIVEAVLFAMHVDGCLGTTDWRQGKVFHLTLHAGATLLRAEIFGGVGPE